MATARKNTSELVVECVQGPLPEPVLRQIAALYGQYDNRYSNLAFCRTKFEDSPAGCAFHALARFGDTVVGHYSLIPIPLHDGDSALRGAKGEAFVVDESARHLVMATENGRIPLGLALPKRLNEFAFERGIELLFMLAPDDVGRIHCACGARRVDLCCRAWHFILDSGTLGSRLKRMCGRILVGAQRLIRVVQQSVVGKTGLAKSTGLDYSRRGGGGITIPFSAEVMEWYRKMGVDLFSGDAAKPPAAAATYLHPENSLEAFALGAEGRGTIRLLRLLNGMISLPPTVGANRLFVSNWAQDPCLDRACALMGAVPTNRLLPIYVNSALVDQLVKTWRINPLFYVTY